MAAYDTGKTMERQARSAADFPPVPAAPGVRTAVTLLKERASALHVLISDISSRLSVVCGKPTPEKKPCSAPPMYQSQLAIEIGDAADQVQSAYDRLEEIFTALDL